MAKKKRAAAPNGDNGAATQRKEVTEDVPQADAEVKPQEFEPGVYEMPAEVYHASAGLSSHEMMNLLDSPAHYVAGKDFDSDTPTMAFGRAFHSMMEGDDVFFSQYEIAPKGVTKKQKAYKELVESSDKEVLTLDEADTLSAMRASVMRHAHASELVRTGLREVSIYWDDESGVRCKARLDLLRLDLGLVIDHKSARSTDEYEFCRSVATYRYHVQSAQYLEAGKHAASALGTKRPTTFAWIAVEKTPPYDVAVYAADKRMIERGEALRRKAIARYAHCLQVGTFDVGRVPKIKVIALPGWALR